MTQALLGMVLIFGCVGCIEVPTAAPSQASHSRPGAEPQPGGAGRRIACVYTPSATYCFTTLAQALAQELAPPEHAPTPRNASPRERCRDACHTIHCDCYYGCNRSAEDTDICKQRCESDEDRCQKSCETPAT